MGVERPSFLWPGCISTSSGLGLAGSAPLTTVPFGMEASSPFEDQGVCLAPFTTALDDEVPTSAHGPELPRGVLVVHRGSGGLLAPILRLPYGPSGVIGGGWRPPHGNIKGGVLAVSRRLNIPSRS